MGYWESPVESMVEAYARKFIQKQKILVTGNTGFKGSWLTTWLIKLGAKVVGISKYTH